jgi:hypothetical protein
MLAAPQACLASRNGLVSISELILSQPTLGELVDWRDVLDARVGDDHVEASEAPEHCGDRRCVGVGLDEVGLGARVPDRAGRDSDPRPARPCRRRRNATPPRGRSR